MEWRRIFVGNVELTDIAPGFGDWTFGMKTPEMDATSVLAHLEALRREAFATSHAERVIELIVRYAQGAIAEGTLTAILAEVSDECLNRLTDVYINPDYVPGWPLTTDWVNAEGVLAGHVGAHGIAVVDGPEGWVLTLPSGRTLTMQYQDIYEPHFLQEEELPKRGHALSRLALLGVWLSLMERRAKSEGGKP